LLHEQKIAELAAVAQESELVLGASGREPGLDFARVGEPHARLSEEIEPDVGERDVFFEHRTVAGPFAEALREHQIAVAEAQQVIEESFVVRHRCFTPSGMGKNVGWRYTLLFAGSNSGVFSPGAVAVMSADLTTQMLTPSLRRV